MNGNRALAGFGVALAVLAELSSAGLLGLSGWFVTACAVAGPAFSYLAPSGGVRAFALARVSGNYTKRLVLHAAALRRVATARADLFHHAAQGRSDGVWSGDLLDRAMADADTAGMALIAATTPTVVAIALAATGVLAVALASSTMPAAVLAAGTAVTALAAHRTPGTARTAEQRARTALRAESVTATDAWPEMASLGAAEHLAARTTARFEGLDTARDSVDRHRRRTDLISGLAGMTTVAATIVVAIGTDPPTFAFVALTAIGVTAQTEHLAAAAEARTAMAGAHHRLTTTTPSRTPGPAMRWWATEHGIGFSDYVLPSTAVRAGRVIGAQVDCGDTLVVTGRSGSGKTTLLRALARSLRQPPDTDYRPTVTAVAADDHLFTGTLGSNWRLADPAMTDNDIDRHLAELWLDGSGLTASTPVGPGGRDLSGGELRRIYLGRALATRPHVLIVDEPTTGLDDLTAQHILDIITNLPETTVVIATHALPVSLHSLDHVSTLPLD